MDYLLLNSNEHIAAVRVICDKYNKQLDYHKKIFLAAHPGVLLEGNTEWLTLIAPILKEQQKEFDVLKKFVL